MSTIDLLRHGEPEGGVRYRGDGVDDPLSESGWAQMWAAVGEASDWTHVVSSPLRRCRDFAEAVAESYDLPLVLDERFREMSFGAWEGRRHQEVRDADPDGYYAFFQDAIKHGPPGSEPLDAFYTRVRSGLLQVFDEHPEGHILLVCHLGVMRAATALALEMPLSALYRMHAPYAGRIRLRRTGRGIELWFGH
ncbi:MAG: histidine phosphatase family protein [Halieaceae bacterium]|jgi:probable phosphoglycerate mutase|nr:histidine phosphatase family protein [Halieaceae bacterium]